MKKSVIKKRAKTVFLCIGTPKIIGDSLGPIVGDELKRRQIDAYVYGTTSHPITALNLHLYKKMLRTYHRNDLIVAIDATMGSMYDIGKIKIKEDGLKPGGAFNKKSTALGDVGIMGIVGENQGDMLLQLKTCDEQFINTLALTIVELIISAGFQTISDRQ